MHCFTFQESFDQGFVYAVCCSMFFSFCHQFGTYLAKNVANSHNLILDYLFTACWIPSMYMIGNIVWNEIVIQLMRVYLKFLNFVFNIYYILHLNSISKLPCFSWSPWFICFPMVLETQDLNSRCFRMPRFSNFPIV